MHRKQLITGVVSILLATIILLKIFNATNQLPAGLSINGKFTFSQLTNFFDWDYLNSDVITYCTKDPEFELIKPTGRDRGSGCNVPLEGFKSWKKGIVTELTPDLHANCTLLFKGDQQEVKWVQNPSFQSIEEHTLKFMEWIKSCNCTQFQQELEDNVYNSKYEVAFPIVFALVVQSDLLSTKYLLHTL